MSAHIWLNAKKNQTVDLGDPISLYSAFADMDHVGNLEDYPELWGVIQATESEEEVDPEWYADVQKQARDFLGKYKSKLGADAKEVLKILVGENDQPTKTIKGSRSKSYHKDYGKKTYREIKALAARRPPDRKARQMKKLIEQTKRLRQKGKGRRS